MEEVRSTKSRFYQGDVLYGKLRPYLDKAAIAEWQGLCSTDILTLQPLSEAADPEYIAFLLHTSAFLSHAVATTSGVNHPRTSWADIAGFPCCVPLLPEQRAIAGVLAKIQAAVEVQEKIVAKLKELKAATMAKLFREGLRGKPLKQTEIGEIPESWEVVPFGDAVSIAQGQVDPRVEPYASMIHIGPENVEADTGRLLECKTARELGLISGKYLFQPGDIVYSKIRPYLRKAVRVDFVGVCSADMYPLTPRDGFDAPYLHAFILSENFTRQAASQQDRTGIPKLNREQLNSILIPKPHFSEQCSIGRAFAVIEQKLAAAVMELDNLKALFSSMLHLLMTGRVRVTRKMIALQALADRKARRPKWLGKVDEKLLEEIVKRVVEFAAPERIILFGSAARGEMGPDSDLDLLVIKSCENCREVARAIRRNLLGIGVPKDVVVATPEDVEEQKDVPGMVVRAALKEGRVLYAA